MFQNNANHIQSLQGIKDFWGDNIYVCTLTMLKLGSEAGWVLAQHSASNIWFQHDKWIFVLVQKWKPSYFFLFHRPLFWLLNTEWQTGRWSDGRGGIHPSRQAERFPIFLHLLWLSKASTSKSSCHASTLRFKNSSSATIKWMQECRVKVSRSPAAHPHGPVGPRGDISFALKSLDYQYCSCLHRQGTKPSSR